MRLAFLVLVVAAFVVTLLRTGPGLGPVEGVGAREGSDDRVLGGKSSALSGSSPEGEGPPEPSPEEDAAPANDGASVTAVRNPRDELLEAMEGYGRVIGSVVLPDGTPPQAISMTFQAVDDGNQRNQTILWSNGRFEEILPAHEPWTLTIAPHCGRVLFEGTFSLVEGETVRPPELQDIDLTGLVHRVEINVLDPGGRPMRAQVQEWSCARERLDQTRITGYGGRVSAVCGWKHSARISQPGHVTQHVELFPGKNEITLALGPQVRLNLADPSLVEDGWTLGATAIHGGRLIPGRYLEFDADGVLETSFSEAGRFDLVWTVRQAGGSHHRIKRFGSRIHVEDQDEVQDITLTIPDEVLRAAMTECRDG